MAVRKFYKAYQLQTYPTQTADIFQVYSLPGRDMYVKIFKCPRLLNNL